MSIFDDRKNAEGVFKDILEFAKNCLKIIVVNDGKRGEWSGNKSIYF